MKQLLTRHSVGPKHLAPPVPTEEQIWLAVSSALRAPDHQKLLPFRFVLIPDDARLLLGELFADFARKSGKSDEEIVVERNRARLGPLLLAFVTCIEKDHPRIPPHEQWLTAGGALSNFLTALHIMGFGAKMLSGRKAADSFIRDALVSSMDSFICQTSTASPAEPGGLLG